MAENEFEKRVQDKLEQFNLAPTPGVWQTVTDRVRKEKKRRFLFFWILLGLLVGGGGTATFLFIKGNQNNSSPGGIVSAPAPGSKKENDSVIKMDSDVQGENIDKRIPAEIQLPGGETENDRPRDEKINNFLTQPKKIKDFPAQESEVEVNVKGNPDKKESEIGNDLTIGSV